MLKVGLGVKWLTERAQFVDYKLQRRYKFYIFVVHLAISALA